MEQSVEQKLQTLYDLQTIHCQVDKINQTRGELPLEVADLEDEIAGLNTRIQKIKSELDELDDLSVNRKNSIKQGQAAIKKYQTQLNEVKNNREFEAISKEVELQTLDIQVTEKKLKEQDFDIESKTTIYQEALAHVAERTKDFERKKAELEQIDTETEKEIKKLSKASAQAESKIDERLLTAYKKLRENAKNGLAVVSIKRGSCGGCFNQIPPQRQLDIRQRKKIIVCEHCGRILIDEAFTEQVV